MNSSPWELVATSLPGSCQNNPSLVVSGTTSTSITTLSSSNSLLLYQESNISNQVLDLLSGEDTQYYFLEYSSNGQSYLFGTEDQTNLSLNELCPIEIEKGTIQFKYI